MYFVVIQRLYFSPSPLSPLGKSANSMCEPSVGGNYKTRKGGEIWNLGTKKTKD